MPEDAVVTECLDRLRTGCIDAAGVLVDRLEELGDERARVLRAAWAKMLRRSLWWETRDWIKNKHWTRWQAIADERRQMRGMVMRVFKRKWKRLPLQTYSPGPKAELPEQET